MVEVWCTEFEYKAAGYNNNNKHSLFTINVLNYTIYLPMGRELK